jgi:hypothetical protein
MRKTLTLDRFTEMCVAEHYLEHRTDTKKKLKEYAEGKGRARGILKSKS